MDIEYESAFTGLAMKKSETSKQHELKNIVYFKV